ncbi:MAG: ABC transporter permease [Candidatus Nanopelagicales bacterium]
MSTGLLTGLFLRDYARNGVNVLVLFAVPFIFVLVAASALADAARLLGGVGDGAGVQAVAAGWAAAFTAALGMYFQVAGNRETDRRLVVSGLPRGTLIASRALTGLALALVAATAALAALAIDEGIGSLRVVIGTVLFALVYAGLGSVVGAFVRSPVNGTVAILFIWIIDVFFGPALSDPSRAVTRVLPTHFVSLWMSGTPSGHSGPGGDATWALSWLVLAIVAAAAVLLRTTSPGRVRRPRRPSGVPVERIPPHPAAARPRRLHPGGRYPAALTSGLREWSRNRMFWVLLILVPAVFILLSDAVTPPGRMALSVVEQGASRVVLVDPADIHAGTMAPSGIAALATLAGLFVILDSRASDRRLAVSGMRAGPIVLARLAMVGIAAATATAAAVVIAATVFTPRNWAAYIAANLLLALVYGSIGVLIGPIFGRVSGVFMAFVIPFLDISISQSPMLRAQPEAWAQFLPGYGGVRLLLDGVATAGFDETRGLALAAAWALAALAAAAWLIYASTGGNDGRRGREARFG